jgi:hypothetical protein
MPGGTEDTGPEPDTPLTTEIVRDAAADTRVTTDELNDALHTVQEHHLDNIYSLHESAWLHGGAQDHLFDTPDGVFFAMPPFDLLEPLRDADGELQRAVCTAHKLYAQHWGFEVDTPTAYESSLKNDYQPVFIRYPEIWTTALSVARLRVQYLLSHDLTAAQALDYWGTESGHPNINSSVDLERWLSCRDVGREAVRKNVREASENLGDEDHQPYHPDQEIEVREVTDR